MSIKAKKSRIQRIIATTVAAALSVGGVIHTGPYKKLKEKKEAAHVKAETLSLSAVPMARPLSFAFVESTTDAITSLTTTVVTTLTATTCTTSTATTSTTTAETGTTDVVTSAASAITETVTESTENATETPVEVCETTTTTTEAPKTETTTTVAVEVKEKDPSEVVYYKPSTHYIHRGSCHWYNEECYEIDSTEGLEVRRCTECNPDIEIITPYEEPTPATTDTAIAVTDYEYIILCNLVAGEYGSDCVSVYDKGAVVATVIHRLWEGTRWTGGASASIYNVIAAPYQYDGKYLAGYYAPNVTQSCKDAVTYALNNIHDYDYYCNPDGTSVYMINSFHGDGRYNWFRCS